MFSVHRIKTRQALASFQNQKRTYFSRAVHYLFKRNLLLTNSITSGAFMGIGDLVQQEFDYRAKRIPERYDWARAARMTIVGTLVGPLHHFYYVYLDKLIPRNDARSVLKKLAGDQFIASPLTILFFFYAMGILEEKPLEGINDEIKTKFKFVYMGDWLFWPPIQWINFYYLPTEYRVFYINIATMVFDIFLSYCKHID